MLPLRKGLIWKQKLHGIKPHKTWAFDFQVFDIGEQSLIDLYKLNLRISCKMCSEEPNTGIKTATSLLYNSTCSYTHTAIFQEL